MTDIVCVMRGTAAGLLLRFTIASLFALALPAVGWLPASTSTALALQPGSSTAFVLDISGSMDSPGVIPAGFPDAARLKQSQDTVERFIEQAKPGNRVSLQVLAGALASLGDFIRLQQALYDWMKTQNLDPNAISKLYDLKVATTAMLNTLKAERDAGLDQRAGLVTFSSDASILAALTDQPGSLLAAVDGLAAQGSTNIGGGLQKALDMLGAAPNPSIVLITDGWNNTGMTNAEVLAGPVQKAAAAHIPICTIGVGQSPADVDQNLLNDISRRTGGGYYFVGDGVSLGPDVLACHHSLRRQLVSDLRGTVKQGETVKAGTFQVAAGKASLVVTLSWPGSKLELQLTDPSGRAIADGYPGARVASNAGLVTVTLSNPPAGAYAVSVHGSQTGTAGDPFAVSTSTDGQTSTPHMDPVVGGLAANPSDVVLDRLTLVRAVGIGILVLLMLWAVVARFRKPRPQPAAPVVAAPPGAPPAPVTARTGSGCGGCLWWALFVVVAIVAAGAHAGIYLWQTPLLTFPQV